MTDGNEWTLTVARHQAPLDEALQRFAADTPADRFVVVVRSRETEDRLRRILPFPTQIVRLADFLGAIGATPCATTDLLPDEVVHGHLVAALPPALKSARDALADDQLRTIQTLATNGLRPPYPGSANDPAEDLLESAHAALLEALRPHNAAGRYAAFQRVLLAHTGAPRLHQRFPGITTVLLSGIDWLSPAEELALEHTLRDHVHVHIHAIGRPPRTRDEALDGPAGRNARWAALEHTDRLVRWAAHWRTGPIVDLHDADTHGPIDRLETLFALHPHEKRPLPDVHIVRPADPEREVHETAARIRDLLDSQDGTVRPEDIAVVVPRLERYAEPLQDVFDAHGIPHTIRHGPPLATTAPGTLLRLILSDLDHAHARDHLLDLIAHPLFRWNHAAPDGTTTPIIAPWHRKVLARRGLTPRGTNGWRRAYRILEESQGDILGGPTPAPSGDEDPETDETQQDGFFTQQRDAVLDLLEHLDKVAQAPDAETFFTRLRDFLQRAEVPRATRRTMRHSDDPRGLAHAFDAVLDLLDETQRAFRLRDGKVTATRVRETLMRRLHTDPLPITTDRTWGVQVLGLRNAGGLRFRQVHLLGATADDLPPPAKPRRLERLLERRFGRDRLRRIVPDQEARRILHGLLADTEGTRYLSAPKEIDGTPQAPSVLLEELQDAFTLDEPPAVPERIRTVADLHHAAAERGITWTGAPRHLPAARLLLAARNDPHDIGPYTGHLVDPAVRDRAGSRTLAGGGAISASRINRYARCPQHALWGDIARLRGDDERDADVSPLDKGRIVHTIIDRWSRDLIERNGAPARIADTAHEENRLLEIATDLIGGLRIEGLGWEAYKEELLGGLRGVQPYADRPPGLLKRFLEDRKHVAVVASEVPFGGEEHPVHITHDGTKIPVHGTIDRIEEVDGALQVIDLKTGEPPKRKETLGGIDLQVPLYVIATQTLYPDQDVALGGYYKLKRATRKHTGLAESVPRPGEGPEELQTLVAATPERVAKMRTAEGAGHHPLTLLGEAEAKCQWCDHRYLCGRRPHLTPRRREAARELGDTWGYLPDRIDDLMAAPIDEKDADEGGDA